MKVIGINNPRTSFYVGGAEMVSMEHAKSFVQLGNKVYFFTVNPCSIGKEYSEQYLKFKYEYADTISFLEADMDKTGVTAYRQFETSEKAFWYTASIYYNRSLYNKIGKTDNQFDFLLSYFNLDAIVIPTDKVKQNVLYLCGIPKEDDMDRIVFLAMYNKVIAITQETKEYWQKYLLQDISVVHTGVDNNRFVAGQKQENILRILFIGRLMERKGAQLLLKALTQIPESIKKNIYVDIVGDGPSRQMLENLTREYNLSDIVCFHGESFEPEIFFKNADLAVFPSLYGEGLQGVILEAMSAGLCVIASETEINKVLLKDNRGITIKINDGNDICAKIIQCFRNRNLVRTCGSLAREFVVQNYTWEQKTKELLENIL